MSFVQYVLHFLSIDLCVCFEAIRCDVSGIWIHKWFYLSLLLSVVGAGRRDGEGRRGHHSTLVLKVPKVNLLTSQPAERNRLTQSLIFFFSNILAFLIIASNPSLPKPIDGRICPANSPISLFLLFSLDIFGPTDDTRIASDIVLNSWRSFLTIKEARNTSNWVALTCSRIWGVNMTGTPPTDRNTDDDCCHPISAVVKKIEEIREEWEGGITLMSHARKPIILTYWSRRHRGTSTMKCTGSNEWRRTCFLRVHPRFGHTSTDSDDELIRRLSAL